MSIIKYILSLIFPNKPSQEVVVVSESTQKSEVKSTIYVTLQDWITSSNTYPERAKSKELTPEVLKNAEILIERVNSFLNELQWNEKVILSSGFRPSEVNAGVPNGAKRSAHMTGGAMDIRQLLNDNKLGLLIRKIQNNQGKSGILGKHNLMMESLEHTKGKHTSWVHLDVIQRSERPSMEFKP